MTSSWTFFQSARIIRKAHNESHIMIEYDLKLELCSVQLGLVCASKDKINEDSVRMFAKISLHALIATQIIHN